MKQAQAQDAEKRGKISDKSTAVSLLVGRHGDVEQLRARSAQRCSMQVAIGRGAARRIHELHQRSVALLGEDLHAQHAGVHAEQREQTVGTDQRTDGQVGHSQHGASDAAVLRSALITGGIVRRWLRWGRVGVQRARARKCSRSGRVEAERATRMAQSAAGAAHEQRGLTYCGYLRPAHMSSGTQQQRPRAGAAPCKADAAARRQTRAYN